MQWTRQEFLLAHIADVVTASNWDSKKGKPQSLVQLGTPERPNTMTAERIEAIQQWRRQFLPTDEPERG